MTMSTFCKRCLSKMSSRSNEKDRIVKSNRSIVTKNEMPSCNEEVEVLSETENNTHIDLTIDNTSRLCNQNLDDDCYEFLEALGLMKVDVKCEMYRENETSVPVENGNDNIKIEEIIIKNETHEDVNNNNKTETKTKIHKCTKCNLAFKSKFKYNQHRKSNHPCSKILYCKICSKTFKNSELLSKHKKCHSGKKPYCCVQCDKTFVALQSLTAHIRRHAGKLPYTCKICKMGFDIYSDCVDHQHVHLLRKTEHPKLKIYKCTNCSKEFRKFCDLERHTRVHTGEKPYTCKICKNRFQQVHNLTKHMIIHTKEKQFKCEICQKEFGRSDVLSRHMITHAIQKPHACDYCNKSFGRVSQLIDHVRKHHPTSQ